MAIFALAWKSLLNRRFTAGLTIVSIALSVALLVGVERLRTEGRIRPDSSGDNADGRTNIVPTMGIETPWRARRAASPGR